MTWILFIIINFDDDDDDDDEGEGWGCQNNLIFFFDFF